MYCSTFIPNKAQSALSVSADSTMHRISTPLNTSCLEDFRNERNGPPGSNPRHSTVTANEWCKTACSPTLSCPSFCWSNQQSLFWSKLAWNFIFTPLHPSVGSVRTKCQRLASGILLGDDKGVSSHRRQCTLVVSMHIKLKKIWSTAKLKTYVDLCACMHTMVSLVPRPSHPSVCHLQY